MNKKTIVTLGIVGAVLLGGALNFSFKEEQRDNFFPPIGIIIDMPKSEPGNVYSKMQLLIAGGAQPRDINVVVSDRTHPDNLAVIYSNPYVVKISTTTDYTKNAEEIVMKRDIGNEKFIYAK